MSSTVVVSVGVAVYRLSVGVAVYGLLLTTRRLLG